MGRELQRLERHTHHSRSGDSRPDLCPGSTPIEPASPDGLPPVQAVTIDPAVAERSLDTREADLRARYPDIVDARIGPGYGHTWSVDANGRTAVVAVDDYAIILTLRSRRNCPVSRRCLRSRSASALPCSSRSHGEGITASRHGRRRLPCAAVSSPATRIEAVTLEHIEALLAGDDVFTEQFGMPVAPGYLDFPEALTRTGGAVHGMPSEWYSHLIIRHRHEHARRLRWVQGAAVRRRGRDRLQASRRATNVAATRRRRGAAAHRASAAAGVTRVSAFTLPEANASTRVLTRCGLTMTEVVEDAQEGYVWRWELHLA